MGTIDSWSSIETIIKQRLDRNEIDRRYCVVCGRQGSLLSRCFGCQMVYYCGEEHQAEDWSKEHAQKCAQLEWVALGEFIQALPAQPPLPSLGDKWPLSLREINSWKNWFSIRTNIVQVANNTANIFQNLIHLTDKRQPTHQNAIDGLLAAVTDLLTHVLTIGKAVIYFGLQPTIRPLVIHILSGFNKVDLLASEQSSSHLPGRFHELLNMFPDNKGVELVIVIGDDEQDDTDHSSIPHATLKPDRLIITTTGKGRLFDTSEEKRLQRSEVDLLVYLNAAYLFSASNKDLLKAMLTRQRPTLLTFEDEEEFNRAKTSLSTKGINPYQAGANQFSSLIIRQRSNRPNSTYSTNSYQILLNALTSNGTVERNDENYALLSRQRSHQSSIGMQHGHIQQQQQPQFNPGLKQVNGKVHIESLSSLSSTSSSSSHNTQANNNGTPLDTNVHIASTVNTTTTTTVHPLSRANNNVRQPAIVQRRQHSPPISIPPPPPPSTIHSTTYRETRPTTTTTMLTAIEPTRNGHRPQPKPRLSLAKTTRVETEIFAPQVNGSIIQRIKPVFEQPAIVPSPPPPEPIPIRQQRQPISIPYTYQIGKPTKSTCLDDVIPSKNVSVKSTPPPVPPPPPIDTYISERTAPTPTIIPSSSPIEVYHDQRHPISRPFIERHTDERTIKSPVNSVSSPLTIPIEIHHDQRTVINTTTTIAPPPLFSSVANSFDERVFPAVPFNVSSTSPRPTENRIDQSTAVTPATSLASPPPRPPPPPLFANNEVIYTEVVKNHERSFPTHHIDLIKSPISPSRSFIMPTKSPSISSKNSSFNYQRPSRPIATNNFSYHTTKPKPMQSMMAADRISLYSQRSNKQADVGVTIKNLSECIDRVGIVFDETNRPNNAPSAGLTTVDLIREQLTSSSASKSTGSLLEKLYKSNSSTRLSTPSSRTSTNSAFPRSKSQQTTRIQIEQPPAPETIQPIAKTVSPTTTQPVRRTVGVFLPLAPKTTPEPTQTTQEQQSPTLVYQNLEPHTSTIRATSPSRTPDYTLKQHIGPVCNGIPKPFRKPTAIIEPSPVITSPITKTPEPNYINLIHHDEHIYSNENGITLPTSSNSNSYTSKTSSIYSSSDKQNLSTQPEIVYAISNIPSSSQQDQSVDYDSFDDELVVNDPAAAAKIEKPFHSNDNTDDDSFDDDDDDENQPPLPAIPSKNSSSNFFRSTLNRLTRSNKSLERLTNDSTGNDVIQDSNPSNIIDTKTKKTLRSIKARHEAKKTGNSFLPYTNDDDTTSIDSNCSTQTATSLNKTSKSSHTRFRLFRRKIEKEFASDTEAEKHQTEQRRKKFNKKLLNQTANELKTKRLLMMSDDDDEEINVQQDFISDEPHIYDHIIHDDTISSSNNNNNNNNTNSSSRMGKLSNETHFKSPTTTLDEIRSEIQAEIAARHEKLPLNNQSLTSSNLTLQKKRSKSVTFLDELLGDDSKVKPTNVIPKRDLPMKTSTTIKRVEKGDARSICGALTGTGPIRGIIKAANNDVTGTTAPVSPSAAAAIYLSGTSIETRCTSPKTAERTHRPLSTYTVGSARFYDGAPVQSTPAPPPPPSFNQNVNPANQRPILNTNSHHSTSDHVLHKRPTAKVSPFQTKSPNDSSSSPPVSSTSKKPIRPAIQRNGQLSQDITNIATPSLSDGVGGVSKRLQSTF